MCTKKFAVSGKEILAWANTAHGGEPYHEYREYYEYRPMAVTFAT